jgi:outer membrane protein
MSKIQITINIVFVLLFSSLLFTHFTSANTMVYVDSARLLNGYEGMIKARKDFQQKATSWQANIDTLSNEVKIAIMDYEKSLPKMTAKERELSKELIKTKQNQLAQYQQALSTQAQQEDQKMTGDIIIQVNAYLKKYGEKNGYTIIFAATDYGNIAYAKEALDVTDDVLVGLNAEYKGQ